MYIDSSIVELIKIITVIFGIGFLVESAFKIVRKGGRIYDYACIIFFIFNIVPVACDLVYGIPYFQFLYGLNNAGADLNANFLYSLFSLYYMIVIRYLFNRHKPRYLSQFTAITANNSKQFYHKYRYLIYTIIFLPLILLIGAPEKEKYLIYGYLGMRDLKDLGYFSLINYACNLSVVAVFVVLLLRNFNLWGLLGFMPVLLLDSWINGKRNIVFLIVFFIIYLVFTNRRFSLLKKSIFTFVFVGFSVWFTSFYTSEIKKDVTGNTDKYTQYRIDFSRDHTLKLAIYSELHPERAPILDYRGETMLFYLTIFVPRNLWPDKPLTYAQYITAAGLSQKAGYIGWGLTSSIFDELVANFGLWILLLCPWIIFKMIRFGESAQNKFVSLFTIFIVGVFMTVEITAYYILVIGWILLVRKFAKENRLFMKKLKKYKKWQEEIYLTGPSQS